MDQDSVRWPSSPPSSAISTSTSAACSFSPEASKISSVCPVAFAHPQALFGRVPQLLDSGQLEHAAGVSLDCKKSFVYLCGNPQMVKDTSNSLKNIGLEKHLRRKPGQFASENYW